MLNDQNAKELIDAMRAIGTWIKYLGTGQNSSQMGAIEFLATNVEEAAQINSRAMRGSMNELAQSLDRQANAIESAGKEIAEGLNNVAEALEKIAEAMTK